MSAVALIARCLLALVFAAAAAAKLADRRALRETLRDFDLPGAAANAGVLALPVAEIGVAALLLPSATARWGALAALVLLAVFSVAIARLLVRGETPDCGCFGHAAAAPVSTRSLVRNGALGVLAAMVLAAGPGASVVDALTTRHVSPAGAALTVLLLLLTLLAWLGSQLFRQNGRLLERVQALEEVLAERHEPAQDPAGLPVGSPAPAFELADGDGRSVTLDDLLEPGAPVALVFSDPGCGACDGLASTLKRVREEAAGSLALALIGGSPEARAVTQAYGVRALPSATIVDPHGGIAKPLVSGRLPVEELLASSVGAVA